MISNFYEKHKKLRRAQRAVAKESEKYSSRSPISCSWRIESARTCCGFNWDNKRHRTHLVLLINIFIQIISVCFI